MDSKWNIETLKELMEQRFVANERSVEAAFKASEKAIEKSETAQTAYNARSNEFRAALDDQSKTFLPRAEADVSFKQLREQITTLQQSDSRGEGMTTAKSQSSANTKWLVALTITVALSICGWVGSIIFFLATRK